MEEEIKKQSKFKRGCLGCLGKIVVIVLCFIIFLQVLALTRGTIFIRPEIYGKVVDKQTNKPIANCIIYTSVSPVLYLGNATVLSDKKGNYRIRKKFIYSWCIRGSELLIPQIIKREGQYFSVWFPGYKKYEIQTEGKKLLSGRHNIYLERPKTAEEAYIELNAFRESIEEFGILPKGFGKEEINKKMKEEKYESYAQLIWNVFVEKAIYWILKTDPYWKDEYAFSPDRNLEYIMKICQTQEIRDEIVAKIPCEKLSKKMKSKCYEFKRNYKSKWR